jgi:hypothetical protein
MFVDNEPHTKIVDLKVEKVLNDNTDTLKGGIFHYYVDIES